MIKLKIFGLFVWSKSKIKKRDGSIWSVWWIKRSNNVTSTGPHWPPPIHFAWIVHASTCARRHWLTPKFFMFGRSHKRSLACSPRLKNCQIILLAASLVNWFLLMFEWVCGSCLDERLSYDIGIKIGKGQRYGEGCIARWPALNLVECDRISMIVDRRC